MKTILIIARRELRTFFDSLIAYILLALFLGFMGFFTWLYGTDVFMSQQASLGQFFAFSPWVLLFFSAALTMKMLAEEKNTGTLEVMLTRAVSDWQIIAGKYMACMAMIVITLLFTVPYYIGLAWLGKVDHGAIVCGYLGLVLLSSAFIGIGIFASSITSNQIVAFLLSLGIGFFLLFILYILGGSGTGSFSNLLTELSMMAHFDSISRGVIDTRDVIYFVSITLLGLILAERQLITRNVIA